MQQPESWQVSDNAAEVYEQRFVPAIFGEWGPRVADAAGLSGGDQVLDVACGTGVVARECARRLGASGRVTGLDINDGMLAVARRLRPEIDWRQGDAAALPFDDGSFEAVGCQFALMFFPDRVAALRKMWRVLARGGRLAVAVCGPIEDTPAYPALVELLERHAGPEAAGIMLAPFVLGDRDGLVEVFGAAGIDNIEISTQWGRERFESIDMLIETEIKGSPFVELLDESTYKALLEEGQTTFAFCQVDDGRVEFPMPAYIVTVRKG